MNESAGIGSKDGAGRQRINPNSTRRREQMGRCRTFLLDANRAGEMRLALTAAPATAVVDDLAEPAIMTAVAVAPGSEVVAGRRPAVLGLAGPDLGHQQQTSENHYCPHGNQNRFFPGLPENHYGRSGFGSLVFPPNFRKKPQEKQSQPSLTTVLRKEWHGAAGF
jgi:hypothetical protein